jgi:3,4-dihydroxy 2-butanone 4-phosphate synthase/GTP cyclohydrolase II
VADCSDRPGRDGAWWTAGHAGSRRAATSKATPELSQTFQPGRFTDDSGPLVCRDGVTCLADARLPTRYGDYHVVVARVDEPGVEVVALVLGDLGSDPPPLTRIHSECVTGEVFGSLRCDCREQLALAQSLIEAEGRGVVIYLRQEGRGIGLVNKIRAYALQDRGLDTVEANVALGLPIDGRDYAAAAAMLRFFGVPEVRLLTNNPAKVLALQRYDVRVSARLPLEVPANDVNRDYLRAKAERLGHVLNLE